MLEYLRIRNLALIEDMELEFASGINVLTGETGAGKSFILKALGFLLGDKLGADMVRPGAERAQVEALFALEDGDLVLRRELVAESGRSRLYINDALSSQESLRELRSRLVSHTSQHAQQKLLQPAFQARLFEDAFPEPALLEERDRLVAQLRALAEERDALRARQEGLAERRDLLEMQQQEIDKVAPQEGEEERLEAQRAQARDAEARREDGERALLLLHGEDGPGLLDLLAEFERLAQRMGREGDDRSEAAAEAAAALRQELSHLSGELRRQPAVDTDVDLDKVEERLFLLAQLKRRLKRTLPEILSLREEIVENLSFLDVCSLDLSRLKKEEALLVEELGTLVARIVPLRREAAGKLAKDLEEQLRGLGFSEGTRVIPEFTPHELWPGINDERGRLLWAPNPGQPAQPLDRIASGGELSRFLLALAGLRTDQEDATYIFDEVDAGVGGMTLNKLADRLVALAGSHQMLLITHWPQLAARAQRHFQISKVVRDAATYTLCAPLDAEGRRQELARMAGGGTQGEAVAHSLLE
ncbi:MAG: AAA family ATPase [Desulfovibrio sp.]|uniref:DNA repair protein RecN n=1 Tax=Desulfovibrio sp. TaxID=885 RepID=UPI001A6ACF72|nr:AAA family ATPase [Desulfovibrio sp.]MBD5417608.1 AAA family ATPase [Desulfovibrio sp.]